MPDLLPPPLRNLFLACLIILAGCAESDAGDDFVIEAVTADDLRQQVQDIGSELVVVNFWASWCAPCREEFPEFMQYDSEHPDVAVRFVSVDFEDDLEFAAEFLREQGVTGTTYLKTGRDQAFIDGVSRDWTGSIPATAVYDRNGALLTFWEGKVSYEQLASRVDAVRSAG